MNKIRELLRHPSVVSMYPIIQLFVLTITKGRDMRRFLVGQT